ncbi:hypothetical protein FW774_02345 (plasmid) [Pedobacter sp. BS3]|uniref:hypothetical protein n=1 Tax=Pedobacter sp. BS3 TaxID=2567937 RepID=UPI0011EC7A26|nr:hypothetical protein [Pedobacter sp. BS3]TZF85927.1 hypothetical protein FW774_02345 [Pedobacter sp. BS3]
MPSEITVLIIAFIINTLIYLFFCIDLRKALAQVDPVNRSLNGNLIWLLLVPVVNIVLNFFVVNGMAKSLKLELLSRDYDVDENPGFWPGMVYAMMSILIYMPMPMTLLFLLSFTGLIFFIRYWMKINWYRKVLENNLSDQQVV